MRSEVAYADSRTSVTCVTPPWGSQYPATSAAIELWSDNVTVDAGLDYDIEYDFYPVVEEIVGYPDSDEVGGRAIGNETVYLRGYGFNPVSSGCAEWWSLLTRKGAEFINESHAL